MLCQNSLQSRLKRPFQMAVMAVAVAITSGCASMLDIAGSQLEVPTLENNANRAMHGLSFVKANDAIFKMPISADAEWPKQLSADLTDQDKAVIETVLHKDPYVATQAYTIAIQESTLGGMALATPPVSPLAMEAYGKIKNLYGNSPKNWPKVYKLDSDFSGYAKFKGGQLKKAKALNSDLHKNLDEAVISLMPINYQKNLKVQLKAMNKAKAAVIALKAKEKELEGLLDSKADSKGNELSEAQLAKLKAEQAVVVAKLEAKETVFDEKETIYLTKLDEATEVLKADIRLSEAQIKLARNIDLATSDIKLNSAKAGTAFTAAFTNLLTKGCYQNLPKELETLARGKVRVPIEKQKLFDQRLLRLKDSAIFLLPAIGVGSYYAITQASLAGKYQSIAEIIIEADEAKKEKEAEQAKLKAEAESKNKA